MATFQIYKDIENIDFTINFKRIANEDGEKITKKTFGKNNDVGDQSVSENKGVKTTKIDVNINNAGQGQS